MSIVASWMKRVREYLHIGKIEAKLELIEGALIDSVIEEAAKGQVLLENVTLEMAKGHALLTNDQQRFEVRLAEIDRMVSRLVLATDIDRSETEKFKGDAVAEVAALAVEIRRLTGIIEQHFKSIPHGHQK